MKVFIAVVFTIGSVSALGSGPYLPSGWRPQGPSFFLPSEVAKPTDSPVKADLIQETEASGSDALREYGPPKVDEVVQFSISQGLPDVATEQTFFVQSLSTQELESTAEGAAVQGTTEQAASLTDNVVPTTEAQIGEIAVAVTENISEAQPTFEAIPLDVGAEIVEQTSEAAEKATEEAALGEVAATAVSAQEEVVLTAVIGEVNAAVQEEAVAAVAVEKVAEEVNNIAEAIVKLENEVKTAEALEAAVDVKDSGSLQQGPESLLEYGPPGFREYGPPKQEDIARSAAVQVASVSPFENNEVRRRRFSPKLKTHKKH